MPNFPNFMALGLLLIAATIVVIAIVLAIHISDRISDQEEGLPPKRERRREFPTSPAEAIHLRTSLNLEPDSAVLSLWMYSGDFRASVPRWRERRDLIRSLMPTLARNLDRLVREWENRADYMMPRPYRPGVTEYDHRGALYGVALSWEAPGRWPRFHRARMADVRHVYPELAEALDRLCESQNFQPLTEKV